jgi:hypothetical protein
MNPNRDGSDDVAIKVKVQGEALGVGEVGATTNSDS